MTKQEYDQLRINYNELIQRQNLSEAKQDLLDNQYNDLYDLIS